MTPVAVIDAKTTQRSLAVTKDKRSRSGKDSQGHICIALASGPRDFRGCRVLLRSFVIIYEEEYKPTGTCGKTHTAAQLYVGTNHQYTDTHTNGYMYIHKYQCELTYVLVLM